MRALWRIASRTAQWVARWANEWPAESVLYIGDGVLLVIPDRPIQ
jgi:hypothetical protein